jgi:ATP-dependent DNA ligase
VGQNHEGFTRIRDAVAALPVASAVLDGEAVILRPDNSLDLGARSRQRQAKAVRAAYNKFFCGNLFQPTPSNGRKRQ